MSSSARAPAVDARLLQTLERSFANLAGADAVIDVAELQKALGLRSDYLARRVLERFDRDGDGLISRDEFIDGVRRLIFGSDHDKLEFVFRLHDHDGDGSIDEHELFRMIALSLAEADVQSRGSQTPEILAHALMAMADKNRDGRISFGEFEQILRKRPEILRRMTRSEAQWISPNEDLLARLDAPLAAMDRAWRLARFLENRWLPVVFLGLWAAANFVLFTHGILRDRAGHIPNIVMQVGRATGVLLNLNCALILIPVMRRLLTWVRSSWIGRAVPVDEALDFHRIVGHSIFGLGMVHSAAFVFSFIAGHSAAALPRLLFASNRGLTGLVLVAVLSVMWAFALERIRRSSRFELFYFTHLLYVVFFALALIHAPSALPWLALPLVGYGVEQLLRRRRRGFQSVVGQALAMRSGVTRLDLQRPQGFEFQAGDYVFLRIPAIAKHEWHPFTISSAPENDVVTVHIRSLGNWTSALRRHVEAEELKEKETALVVHVDGPYGSPSAHIFNSRFAVFIGAGIGVTPFASVLESLVLRANGEKPPRLTKAHFFWLNRDQYSFEWFTEMLSEIERIDTRRLLEVHLCMTAGRVGATAVGLEIAREVTHAAGYRDVVTGLRTMTHMGPPDWETMLKTVVDQHAPDGVDVYFCGPPGLAAKLRPICARLGMVFRMEQF